MPEFNGLTITEVRITLVDDAGHAPLKAYAKLTLNDAIAVNGMRIIRADDGRMFVTMPTRKRPDGGFRDLAHPTCPGARRWLESAVIAAYGAELRRVADERLAALKAAG